MMPRRATTSSYPRVRPTSPPFSGSRRSPSRKRSGRRLRTISPAPAPPPRMTQQPGFCSLTCTGCSRIGRTRHRRQPSLSPSSRQMSKSSTHKGAQELAPNAEPILSRYLTLLNAAKNFPEERTVLQAALDRNPQNASLKGDLIRVEAEIGGLEAGLAKARRFANDDPGN